ncbi:aminoglycoside phosphotransferase family protein [Streptomyces sp. H10-C2]|uniref:phosphotransferase enzyme family protein n=1 Tax=unclassified Streptomyces TaxID=2593676 RepID=UPI0024BA20AF|nr:MULTISPECIES: aminoglycoside phosphotransferase family protein [unclassified Streptomyces]MDJ0340700.1 aminoglycoside phosphotransferase family protein [Streptomyces sp. PH10-H1]MDJ0372028.1 aminoglycoside phosphotransferase family protein [Streptomyces sp. H10-C2]
MGNSGTAGTAGAVGAAFTEERARTILAAATDAAGGARLLALGENAVFAVGGLVVKIGRSAELLERAGLEVLIAGWLAEHGVPAVRAAEPRARLVDGHPVTYWDQLPEPVRPAGPADLAALLRLVHALPEPPDFTLPPRDLLGGVERWLRLAGGAIDPADAAYLRGRRDGFASAAAELTPRLPRGPIHGDALPRNVQVGPDGPVLVDLETFSTDLREHDLVVMALSRDRYGPDPAAYDAFTAAYGWDVREWDGCAVLRGARETASCAWVAQHAPANPAALAEFRRRVASLRDGDPTVRWYPF